MIVLSAFFLPIAMTVPFILSLRKNRMRTDYAMLPPAVLVILILLGALVGSSTFCSLIQQEKAVAITLIPVLYCFIISLMLFYQTLSRIKIRLLVEPSPLLAHPKKQIVKGVAASCLFFLALFIFYLVKNIVRMFGDMSMGELIFQMGVPLESANTDFIPELAAATLFPVLFWIVAIAAFMGNWYGYAVVAQVAVLRKTKKISLFPFSPVFLRKHFLPISGVMAVLLIAVSLKSLGIVNILTYAFCTSTFVQDNYVDPRTVELILPEEKKNLIYIMLESMENSYASRDLGGAMDVNLIPELTKLAQNPDNISFSNTDTFCGGAVPLYSCSFTLGSTVGQTSGMPYSVPLDIDNWNDLGKYEHFLPGVYTIGEVLENEGYNQVYLIGSGAEFSGRDKYFTQHGTYTIKDYATAVDDGIIPPDYHVFWGYEDAKLYEYAKKELLNLAAGDQPFNLTMLTVDTHAVGGYVCPLCPDNHDEQYANVIACASRQLYGFVQWIQAQDFYADTVIVISGDHNSMDADFFKDLDDDYQRSTYNVIINSPVEGTNLYNRTFSPMDMFPTTLAAMDVKIKGEQLGLGVNLFSGVPTVLEKYGASYVNTELAKRSPFYYERICKKP